MGAGVDRYSWLSRSTRVRLRRRVPLELARAKARSADVVVINHALLAQDLISPNPLFDDRDLLVIDEVHELQDYLSSAWGAEVFVNSVDRIITNAARRAPKSRQPVVDKAFSAVGDAAIVAQS